MNLLSRRSLLAIAAVVDIALHSRPRRSPPRRSRPASSCRRASRDAAAGARPRQDPEGRARSARRLRTGARAPAHHARRNRAHGGQPVARPIPTISASHSRLLEKVVEPSVRKAGEPFLANLDAITVEDLCEAAEKAHVLEDEKSRRRFRDLNTCDLDVYLYTARCRFTRRCHVGVGQVDEHREAFDMTPEGARTRPHLRFDHRDDRRHAARPARPDRQGEGRQGQAPRQARVLQPDRQRQGPHRRRDDRRAGGAGQDHARARRAGRADLRQYRHRAGLRRRGARLQADPGDAGIDVDRAPQDAGAARRRTRADARRRRA